MSRDVVSEFLCATKRGRQFCAGPARLKSDINFFLRVEEIVVFLESCYHQGRAFDLPQRCEKRCSHVASRVNMKQVLGKNCTMLKWALVEKGTNFFHRVGQTSIFI